METYTLKVRRRISHYIQLIFFIFALFLIMMATLINITLEIIFLGMFGIFLIIFLIMVIIGLSVSIFIFPNYVIMDYGQIKMAYIFRNKEIYYSDVEWFEIDDLMKTIKLKIISRNSPISFFYSEDELEYIRRIFGRYRIKRRFRGKEKRKN